ncbi:uncharacterized protein LOC125177677, partial [Hyalella azteca]|uniref:Uncharacterized protein LOC125177677 n=1 Tax=Hyalella azteca TaxID=294128 RepID=A0A979FHN5_HYAAZ
MLELNQNPASSTAGGMLSLLTSMDQHSKLVLNPPLAALHTMTDMKARYGPPKSLSPHSPPQLSPQGLSSPHESHHLSPASYPNPTPPPVSSIYSSYSTPTSPNSCIATTLANPHGIENILSRPSPFITTSTGGLSMGAMGGLGRLGGPMGTLYGGLAGKMAELARPSSVYWPGVQGMLQNPLFWRERLQASH